MKYCLLTLFSLGIIFTTAAFAQPSKNAPIGIMTATSAELAPFLKVFREERVESIGGRTFHLGRLEKTKAILVEGGVGKVNASLTASLLVTRYKVRALFFSGVGLSLIHI